MVVQLSELPEEMMIEVFKKVAGGTLKEAALVCSDWNKMISTSAIMKKFTLQIESDVLSLNNEECNGKFKELMSLERHFTSADIYIDEKFIKSRLTDVVERYGKRLIDFKLESPILTPQIMLELLKQVPELEELTLSYWFPIDKPGRPIEDSPVAPVTLKKLKKLAVEEDWNAFQLIRAPALVQLETQASDKYFNPKSFESFLKALPKLETLETGLELFGRMDLGFPFQLKTLVSSYNSFKLDENIKKFILSQAATVETLKAKCDDSEFHEIVLSKFKRLRILNSNLDKLAASPKFYNNLKPLPLVTEIQSISGFSSEAAMQAVLGNCPELVHLECFAARDLPNHLDFIAGHNKNLELLAVTTIRATNARFKCLKTLTLSQVENADHLIAFLKTNPTIETLRIRWLDKGHLSSDSLGVLINETGLKHVEIEGDNSAIEEVFNKIKSGYGTWKTLELSINEGSTTGMPIYNFQFPENPADWKPCNKLSDNEVRYHE